VRAFDDPVRGYRAGAILALVGVINLPIIKFSVDWWNTLHQPASIGLTGAPTIAASMLWPLLFSAIGFTLLFIAIYQMNAWADAKMRKPDVPVTAEVTGRQFNWDVRYPGPDGLLYTPDDIILVDGDIHFPAGEEILLSIKAADVLHSFFLPSIRMKQDVVPGMQQYMWFKCREPKAVVDIVCAELCGWGTTK